MPVLGVIDPDVRAIAEAVPKYDWRVTSIIRPGSTSHAEGLALDIAPMTMTVGEFSPTTARRWLARVRAIRPSVRWAVTAEYDHIHVEKIAGPGPNLFGVLLENKNLEMYPMKEDLSLTDEYETGYGIDDDEIGDALDAIEEDGDPVDDEGEEGDPLTKLFKRPMGAIRKRASKIARFGRGKKHAGKKKAVLKVAAIKAMAGPSTLVFTHVDSGCELASSGIGRGATLIPNEARSLSIAIFEGLPMEPRVIPFTVVGANLELSLPDAGFPAGGQHTWAGTRVEIQASTLNTLLGVSFSVTVFTGAAPAGIVYTFKQDGGVRAAYITFINGVLRGGDARLDLSTKIASTDPPTLRIRISGLSVLTYSANAKLFTPGEETTDKLLALAS